MPAFNVTEQELEQTMFAKMKPNEQSATHRVYLAGMKALFSPATHGQMMQDFESKVKEGNQVSSVLGAGMAHIMVLLHSESKGTMPPVVGIPAGTLLLAKVCEFLNDTHVVQMTDAIFADAVHMMSVVIQHKLDPSFNKKLGVNAQGQPVSPPQSPAPQGLLAQGA